MNTINKFFMLALAVLMFACQKSEQPYPTQMQKAEKMLLNKPEMALSMLDSIRGSIKNQPTETQRYYDLLLFRTNDMCYIPHPSNDTIQRCITYYTKNFDNDKLLTAYYCLGCFYRDKKDYIKASQSFQKALNYASQSKDYSLIGRIYNQLAYLSNIPKDMIPIFKKSAMYFVKAKDKKTLMYSLRDIASCFNGEGLNDSAVYYGDKAYNMALSLKDSADIQVMNTQLADYYLGINKINQAKKLLNRMLLNTQHENDNSLYYSNWGDYYKAIMDNDSATYYYNKCLQVTTDINFKYSSYKALYDIYKKENDLKKAVVCADSLLLLDNEDQLITHDSEVTKQNIHFMVKRVEKENNKLSMIIKSRNAFIISMIVIFIVLVFIGLIMIKKRELSRQKDFEKRIKEEMSKKSSAIINEKINDYEDEVVRQKQRILESLTKKDELKAQLEKNKVLEKKFFNSTIYILSLETVKAEKCLITEQWGEFKKGIDLTYDNFNTRLKTIYPKISEQEIRICNLVKAGFTVEQMAIAMNCTQSNTYNIRTRLYRKMTAKNGSSKDMDKLISYF